MWPFGLDRPLVPEAARSLYDAMFSMREVHQLEGHGADVNTAVFSSDDKWILTASDDGTARLWRADSGRACSNHRKALRQGICREFHANDRLIVTFDESNTIRLWNADGTAHRSLFGHSERIKSVEVSRSSDRLSRHPVMGQLVYGDRIRPTNPQLSCGRTTAR